MATYDEVRDRLDTGDIVLFSGKGLISMGLKIGSLCTWSHVAMVVRAREPDVTLLYQTTPLCKAKDFFEGTLKNGVQINVMSEAVNGYNGKVAVRHLSVARTPEMLNDLSRFRQEVKNRPYESHIIQMVKAVWDGPLGHVEEDLSSLFCSELVAEAYQRMGLLPSNECGGCPCSEYTPKDFSTEGGGIELLLGATLGEEIVIREG
ncbi:MAG: hypothetical protein KQI81_03885 [Deltaproteobacteria bacterium]|nr:hypothetical protein [Deltaproteobacteria bacterium]